jgi:hypothetical protein
MIFAAVLGIALILLILWDAFESVVLPRRVTRKFRFTRFFYRSTWLLWSWVFRSASKGKRRENYLSYFGPLSLLLLLAIWALGLVAGFALFSWGAGIPIRTPEGVVTFRTYLYLSGTTFFTLGLGDVTPLTPLARTMTAVEAGVGFGFLALIIGYLPGLNQSFSRRETNISLLDARAGSPPTAAQMLLRNCRDTNNLDTLLQHLGDWERWSAELLESHLSYPVLAYFRSQHDNQSWLGALTTILDTSSFVMTAMEGPCARQARLTFAIARHAVVDLSLIFNRPPLKTPGSRLSHDDFESLRSAVEEGGLPLRREDDAEKELTALRGMYEPYLYALAAHFRLLIPPWFFKSRRLDNWQANPWERRGKARVKKVIRPAEGEEEEEEHF